MIDYELHVTIEPDENKINILRDYCQQAGFKFLDLQLSTGKFKRQVMMAVNFRRSDSDSAKLTALSQCDQLFEHTSLIPIRVKLESRLLTGRGYYFETHWKILEPNSDKIQNIIPGNMLISYSNTDRNILYATLRYDWFSTPPFHITDDVNYINKIFIDARIEFKHPHSELVIFDTNKWLDDGWEYGKF
jgi:hypothetical protein